MQLINTEKLTLLGIGSEWLWLAVSGLVLAGTFVVIAFQLRAQRSASRSEQSGAWQRDWHAEGAVLGRLVCLLEPEGRRLESGLPSSIAEPCDFFERLGYLIARKHLSSADVWHDLRLMIGRWWAITEPYIRHDRTATKDYSLYEWFEKLEQEMKRQDRKIRGREFEFDKSAEALRKVIDEMITQLQLRSDAREGRFPTHLAPTATPVQARVS